MKSKKVNISIRLNALLTMLVGIILTICAGCENADRQKTRFSEQVVSLRQETTRLRDEIKQYKAENEQLKEQIEVLSGLPKDKLENLYNLQRINITGYTNFYDKDKDGKKEKLIVYIQPIDEDGDIIKACGDVDVQLWDLNSPEASEALLGRWKVEPSELKKLWFATLITVNYRLTFDVSDKVREFTEPLTVKVKFTDYLTGKIFKEQKVIKPQLD
jgi:hypothetical protein